MRMFF